MATSAGKTLLLLLLVLVVVLILYGPFLYFFTFPFRMIPGLEVWHGEFGGMPFFFAPFGRFMVILFPILWIVVAFWVYSDAEKRDMNGILWALLVIVGNIIGLIVYLLVRRTPQSMGVAPAAAACPTCHRPTQPDFVVCPYCQTVLKTSCPSCGKPVQPDWHVCPYCNTKLK